MGRATSDGERPTTDDRRRGSGRLWSAAYGRLAGVLLILGFALLYAATLDNGLRPGELQGGDLITHQYAQVQGRFSNAPGYPLYTMGGWLWFHAGRLLLGPAANPIAILSSYSTLWALTALGLLYALILEVTRRGLYLSQMTPQRPETPRSAVGGRRSAAPESRAESTWSIAFLVTAFYGVTYFFWYYAVTTEQYASSVAWTLGVVLLAFRWERTRRHGYLLAIAFLTGVALAHQLTLPIILLPLLWFVLSQEPGLLRRPKLIAAAIGLAALPLLSYAYVYLAGAHHPEWRGAGQWASTWDWFWSFVSTRQGRSELTWSWLPLVTSEFPALIWREMTMPGLVVGLLGWVTLRRRRAIFLYACFALYLALCWIDRLGNWYQVIMPMYGLLALGIGAGADWLTRKMGEWEKGRTHLSYSPMRPLSISGSVMFLCLAGLFCYRALISYPHANAHNRPDDTGLAPGWVILADRPPEGSAVMGTRAEDAALNYLTQIWDQRPDLRVVTSSQARSLVDAGAAVAVTRAALPLVPQEVSPDAHYSALGQTLAQIQARPNDTMPAGLEAWTHDFGSELRLVGGQIEREDTGGEAVVRLAWKALARPTRDWSVSVRLTQSGQEIAQADSANPVFGAYPTSRWTSGEVIADVYTIGLPPGAKPDGLTVILYRQTPEGGFANLDRAHFELR